MSDDYELLYQRVTNALDECGAPSRNELGALRLTERIYAFSAKLRAADGQLSQAVERAEAVRIRVQRWREMLNHRDVTPVEQNAIKVICDDIDAALTPPAPSGATGDTK